jgi:subtilisin family serine protease
MGDVPPATAPAATAAATVLLLLLLAMPATVLAERRMMPSSAPHAAGAYFVILSNDPAATYRGDVSGYEATQVQAASSSGDGTAAHKLEVSSAAVVAYAAFLEEESASVASAANVAADDVLYKYKYLLAGFAARITSAGQLAALRRDPRVLKVERAQQVHALTFSTPKFLGLEGNGSSDGSGGAWDLMGGVGKAGEDVSICVIDTGIEPEHPSFSDRQNTSSDAGPYAYSVPSNALYKGNCPIGEEFPAGTCK